MIQLKNLSLRRGLKELLVAANLTINPGNKVGMTGANGAGKSSVFALLKGELHAESGEVLLPPQWTMAHVAQETPALPQSASPARPGSQRRDAACPNRWRSPWLGTGAGRESRSLAGVDEHGSRGNGPPGNHITQASS